MSQRSLRGDILALLLGAGAGQAAAAAAAVATAGVYGASTFGVLGLTTALGSPGALLLGRRYELGLPSYDDEPSAAAVLRHLRRVVLVSLVACLAWSVFVAVMWNRDNTAAMVAAVPIGIVATLAFDTELFQATRTRTMQQAGTSRALMGFSQGIILILGAIVAPTALVAALSYAISRLIAAAWLGLRNGSSTSTVSTKEALRRYGDFPRLAVPTGFLTNLSINVPNYAINALFGFEAGGVFYFARRLISLPLQILGQAVSQATYGQLADIGRDKMFGLLRKLERPLILITSFCIGLAVFGSLLPTGELLGDEWADLNLYLVPVALMSSAQFYVSPYRHALLVVDRLRERLTIQAIRTAGVVASVLIVWASGVDAAAGVWIMGLGSAASYVYFRVAVRKVLVRSLPLIGAV